MKKKHLLLTLLLALFLPWAANAQVMMLFSEDFEEGTMPSGWTQEYINGNVSWSVGTGDYATSTGAGQGTYNAKIQTSSKGYSTRLITPVINLSSVAAAELSFMHIERNWGGDIDELRVYYRTSSSGTWTLLPGQEYTAEVPSWTTEDGIILPNINSTYQIAFEFKSNYGYGVGIDDIEIETAPACPKPIGLTCTNVTTTTATFSWTENGSANDWVIQCCIDPEFMCGNAGLFNVSGTPSFTITSFEPGTTYYARVKSSCGGNGESYWSNVVSFTTKQIATAVGNEWSDNFEGSSNWLKLNAGSNTWAIGSAVNNGGSKALYVSNDSGTSNAYTNTAASFVYATKLFTLGTNQYIIDYDWKANGELDYDFLRVWLAPASIELTAGRLPDGTVSTYDYKAQTPEGWISLDGGGQLNEQTTWQTQSETVDVTAGDYMVVFMWCNDYSSGSNPPAAIDNFSITKVDNNIVGNYWYDNFEGSSCNWELINGSQTNQWTLGTATNNGGSKALYVSNDSGTSNAYTNTAASIVYATKSLTFETAQYLFDYDWKTKGESQYDYLRAWLAPAPVDLAAGRLPDGTTYLSSYADRTPEGWISLDGGGKLNLQTEWQTRHETVNLTAGDHVVVFMWGNDQSSGTNPPAAIDNFSITKVTCPAPIDLIASNITDNSATITWTEIGTATNWLIECCTTNDFTCETWFTVNNTPSFNLTGLTSATIYYVRVKAICGDDDDSVWSDVYSFATVTEVGDYWADDFEGSSCGWQFVNGNLANQWVWGTATHHDEGSHSIYISSDGGTNNTFYYSNSCTVYATKLLHFTDDRYNFSYYWRLGGLEGWASLRVALVPASTTLTASEEVDFYYFPNDWIALDGGEELWTDYNNPSWKHENRTINVPAGNYYLALIWQNRSSAFNPNPPAAVDNFSITRDVCPHDAENVTVEWTTQNSARLVWNGDGSAYEIAYCPFPFNSSDYQLAYSGGTVIELPDLDYGTTYKVKVRAWCDSDHQGFWSDDVYFTTACPEYSGLYNQNFDDCVVGDNLLPRCWNYINECTYNYYKIYPKVSQSESHDSGSSGNKLQLKSLVYYYTNDGIQYTDFDPQPQYAILPVFSDVNDLKMTLWARAESISNSGQTLYDATFKVGVMTDPTDASTFTQVATFTPTTQTYVKYTVDFSSYTGNGQYIAIMIEAAEGWGSIIDYVHYYHSVFIDDVRVFSSNPVPANLTVSDITTTSAQITWTPGGEEETWQVAYKRAVDANWTEIADLLDQPSYGFSGLDPDTEYEVKVRAKMDGNFFNWTEPLSFTTEPICAVPIGLQMIEGSATCQGATVEWVDNGDDFTLMMGPVQFTNYFACFFAGDPGDQIPSDFTTTSAYGFVTARDGERTCAKSNNGGLHNTTADMVLSITVPMESDMTFTARVSSEANYDKAYFSIDGVVQDNFNGLSGDGIWYAYSYTLPAGTHTLRWYYIKDVSVSSFGDCLYVGDLTISSYVVDEWTSFEHASSPYTFTGLASNSLYWTKVIRNCSPTNHSEDSYVAGFLTLPCQAPTNLTIDEVTTEYVAFTFDSELGAYYQYCIVPDGNDPIEYLFEGNTSGPASDTVYYVGYGLLGMHPDTDYRIYVRRKCGDGDFSDVVSVTFHTLNECAAYPTFGLPYTEDFEYVEGINLDDDPTENNLPRCWDYINISSDEKTKYYPVISYSGQNNFLFFSSFYNFLGCVDPQPQYAVLPPMEDVSILKMSFRAKTITNFRGTFSVGVMEGTDASTFEEIVSFDPSTSFQEYTVTFENYTGTGKRIAIMGVAADDSHRRTAVSIDDITIEEACLAPTGVTVVASGYNSVAFQWDAEIGATYQYNIFTPDYEFEEYELSTSVATTTPWFVSQGGGGFSPDTDYVLYVRKKCSDTNFSEMVAVPFHTWIAPVVVDEDHPFNDDFEGDLNWNMWAEGPTNHWTIGADENLDVEGNAMFISNDGGYGYDNTSTTKAFATKVFTLEANTFYNYSYSWRSNGESGYDYLRVVFMPYIYSLSMDYLPYDFYNNIFLEWTALDGGSQLINSNDWNTITGSVSVPESGEYAVVFVWLNDNSDGEQYPAAIDNFSLSVTTCPNPTNLAVSNITATTADVSWTNGVESYTLQYRPKTVKEGITFFDSFKNGQGDWTTYNLEDGSSNYQGQASGWGFWDECFAFIYNTNPPQYLISPEINVEHNNSTLCFQYLAMNGPTYPETFRVGFSSTDNNVGSFTWGEEITSTSTMNDMFEEYAVTIPNDAKYFAIQYTSNDMLALILDNFIICDTYAPGEWVTVENVTSPVTIEGLTPQTVYEWQVQGVCDDGETDWVNGAPFMTLEQTTLTQTIALSSGVNWVSFNVETSLDDLKAALEGTGNTSITIAYLSQNTKYINGRWRGNLTFDLSRMYKISVDNACEITLEGMPVDPTMHPITITPGANWIGFPLDATMAPADAFAGFAVNGDVISYSSTNARFTGGRWRGNCDLIGGHGYIYNSAATGNRTLVFPSPSKDGKRDSSFKPVLNRTNNLPAKIIDKKFHKQ